jgi:DNA modification methylase
MIEHLVEGKVTLHAGDCLDVLPTVPDNSVDACVTDPPYGLEFMGKEWDKFKTYSGGNPNTKPQDEAIVKRGDGWQPGSSYGYRQKNPRCRCCGKLKRGNGCCKCPLPEWDTRTAESANQFQFFCEDWAREVLRVLKPGGHLLSFGGTRTYHRMACAIEDAGFEIRDALMWHHGVGFPKSLNVSRRLKDAKECCTCDQNLRNMREGMEADDTLSGGEKQDVLAGMCGASSQPKEQGKAFTDQSPSHDFMRPLRQDANASAGVDAQTTSECLLQPILSSEGGFGTTVKETCSQGAGCLDRSKRSILSCEDDRQIESGLEGRGDISESARQLRERSLREVSAGFNFDGENGRLCDGASPSDGADSQAAVIADGVRASSRPSAAEQCCEQSGTLAVQSQPQECGAWPRCGRCGKPIVSDGLGTALKPATEIICLARKPLSESTVAANCLKWGVGALNIDRCRIGTSREVPASHSKSRSDIGATGISGKRLETELDPNIGRWPANVIHDGSDEVVGAFPTPHGAGIATSETVGASPENWEGNIFNHGGRGMRHGDSGSAARFFYTAKADDDDRLGSRHPTIKPVSLMQWLVRLITPPGGVVLDPFAGTGTTAEACIREGMRAILIELELEYIADIRRRMQLVMAGPTERACETIKAKMKDKPIDLGPLFGGEWP